MGKFIKNLSKTSIVTVMLLVIFSSFAFLIKTPVYGAEEYIYYGVLPGKIQFARKSVSAVVLFDVNPGSIANSAVVAVVAPRDNTNVKVYTLPDGRLAYEATLNSLQKRFFSLPNGTFFKVVSDRVVSVIILGRGSLDTTSLDGLTPYTFYTTPDGSYVGKEFYFIACQWSSSPSPYRIIALEDSDIIITREDETEETFKLQANTFRGMGLVSFSAYKVESTGNIMIQCSGLRSWSGAAEEQVKASFYVPSAEGGFIGKRFYSDSALTWNPIDDCGFEILGTVNTKVTIWDVGSKRVIQELQVQGEVGVSFIPKAEMIAVESDNPVTLAYIENGSLGSEESYHSQSYNAGVMFMGIKANEETMFYVPANSSYEAYVFAYQDANVNIDGSTSRVKADSYLSILIPGTHKIVSDKPVTIEVIHWPKVPTIQGLKCFGAIVPSIQTVNVKPDVKLSPLGGGEGFPTTYDYIIIAVAAVVIAVVFMLMWRRK